MDTPKEDKVEIFSIAGENEKSWAIDRYQLTVAGSIISVIVVMGGIVWLASGGAGNTSGANVLPTGELEFNQKAEVAGTNDYGNIPYPSVRNAMPLIPDKSSTPTKTPTKAPTPTPTTKPAAAANPTPTPTNAPAKLDPTATPTQSPTVTPTDAPPLTPGLTPIPTG